MFANKLHGEGARADSFDVGFFFFFFFKSLFETKLIVTFSLPHPLPYQNKGWGKKKKPRQPAGPNTSKQAGDSPFRFEK